MSFLAVGVSANNYSVGMNTPLGIGRELQLPWTLCSGVGFRPGITQGLYCTMLQR
jgi:hypothetical protein